ncbi:zinc finger protein, putative [Ichthyophthirius multifiliis]|uniref:Zinc finger protein, putative n=1 Tax=Ichthyophthirius multifiliis TaxID=5932 RepID=G0R5M0_ICHMU|nr:zinc finger protein, putative [Ichthyophthirius multifiliis]EGR27228.1 zinc finger protein, putative [Ichthyophthirius multifiliis]|eukprot:XP_004024112.1 zinc finger protein, putative [Ichthyophthirius multifiliis]
MKFLKKKTKIQTIDRDIQHLDNLRIIQQEHIIRRQRLEDQIAEENRRISYQQITGRINSQQYTRNQQFISLSSLYSESEEENENEIEEEQKTENNIQNYENNNFNLLYENNRNSAFDRLRGFVELLNQQLNNIYNTQGSSENIEILANMVNVMQRLIGNKKVLEEHLNAFPVIQIQNIIQVQENCSICLEDWKTGDHAKILGCMHKFHSDCIDSWLKQKFVCPNCKLDQFQFFQN